MPFDLFLNIHRVTGRASFPLTFQVIFALQLTSGFHVRLSCPSLAEGPREMLVRISGFLTESDGSPVSFLIKNSVSSHQCIFLSHGAPDFLNAKLK